jgi:hypothetical protein
MTVEDAFDARLKAAFAAAEPKDDAESFTARVTGRLSEPARRRALIIGGAGAGGSTIASTQLQDLYRHATDAASGALGDYGVLLALLRPEALAAMTIALMVAVLAFLLPQRS